MGLQINQYPIERTAFGDNDYLDIDYWDGTQYRSAKIKASHLFKVATTAVDLSDEQTRYIIKNDAGEWVQATSYENLVSLMTSGIVNTMPNVVNHNFDSYIIDSSGSYGQVYANSFLYIDINGNKVGTPLRLLDMGNSFARLYGTLNNHFVEVDNEIMIGWTNQVYGTQMPIQVNAPNLKAIIGGFQYDYWLKKLVAPNLKYMASLQFGTNDIVADFPSLEYVSRFDIYGAPNLVYNLPNLKHVGNAYFSGVSGSFTLPALETISNLNASWGSQMTSINLPNLKYASNLGISYNSVLNNINISSLKACFSNYVGFNNNALNQSSVDAILWQFANMDGVNNGIDYVFRDGTIMLNGGTNSAPSASGLQAIAILNSRGVGVATN